MTVEEVNIKITAEAAALKKEIDSVNSSLSQMKLLAQQAAQAAASAVSASVALDYGGAEYGGISADTLSSASAQKKTAPYNTAQVPSLNGKETLIGAVSSGGGESVQPIQINTTVEVDGDSIGQAAASFNLRRNRITNGFSREGV